jgi:hypothetical protein
MTGLIGELPSAACAESATATGTAAAPATNDRREIVSKLIWIHLAFRGPAQETLISLIWMIGCTLV